MDSLLIILLVCLAITVILLIIVEVYGLVDNTKKVTQIVTVTIMECFHNDTGCEILKVYVNQTDLGNQSMGHMRSTKLWKQ